MERIKGNFDISGIKRFQMPGTIVSIQCPKCGDTADIELVDQLYYPAEGDCSVSFECENCDCEISRKIDIVSVKVELNIHNAEIL